MTAATTWRDLAGSRVGVWGVGVEGRATIRRLAAERITPHVVVDDSPSSPAVRLGEGGLEALLACDAVVKSPGISRYDAPARALVDAGVRLLGGLGLWMAGAPRDRVACVTGTKGKSTTTSIAGALCQGLGHNCLTGGNIGVPPWDPDVAPADWYLVETSSYQALDLEVGPRVVVVTSLAEDHLTWHHGFANYARDKLSLCTLAGVEVVVAAAGDPGLQRHRDLLGPRVEWVQDDAPAWVRQLRLLGAHNVRNALLAQRALERLGVPGAEDEPALARAARGYEPLPSRLTLIGTVEGVDFVDDSLSTNTLPTLAAVAAFPGRRVALVLGGHDRGIDYEPLASGLAAREGPLLALTVPDNGPRIASVLRSLAPGVEVRECADLTAAVRDGFQWARPDGAVLLSPAAPSFGRYTDYRDRGDAFDAAMRALAG